MRKTLLLSSLLLTVLTLAACTGATTPTTDENTMPTDTTTRDVPPTPTDTTDDTMTPPTSENTGEARIIEMTVEDWKFSNTAITAKKGENVVIRLTNTSGEHSFTSRDLGVDVAINAGETKDIPLPTENAGTFSFRCAIPCGPGHRDMVGQIVIE